MFKKRKMLKKAIAVGIAVLMVFASVISGAGSFDVFAATETVRMGDNAPMTRDDFTEWRTQRGIRHINFDERIYPACFFFNWARGQSFSYGEVSGEVLPVFLRPNVVSETIAVPAPVPFSPPVNAYITQSPQATETLTIDTEESENLSPLVFECLTPILFTYDELTAIIERVPQQNALNTRSEITLPNRALTEYELVAWITEYAEMGGATAFELAVVREINRVREQYGLRPLALDPALMMSARLKTQEFGDLQYFAHTSPVHGSITGAARMFGFQGTHATETLTQSGSSNAPYFRATPEGIVRGMLASTRGHREILLNPNLYSVGFGSFFSPNSTGPNDNMSHMFYFAAKFGFFG